MAHLVLKVLPKRLKTHLFYSSKGTSKRKIVSKEEVFFIQIKQHFLCISMTF